MSDQLSVSAIVQGQAELLEFVAEKPARSLAIYAGVYVVAIVFSVPGGSLLTIIGGTLFGGVMGGLVTVIAVTCGSICVSLIARAALAGWTSRWVAKRGPRVRGFTDGIRTNAFYAIFVLRLVPMMPFWVSNALPGVLGVRLWVFTTATFVGLLPWTMSFAFFGAALGDIIAAQESANPGCAAAGTCILDFSALTSRPIITGLAIAVLSLVPVGLRWWWWRKRMPGR